MQEQKNLEINTSRQFIAWLLEQRASLAFSTYQSGKLFLIGIKPDGRLSVFERTFERCMGLAAHENSLYMGTLYQLWRMENMLPAGEQHQGYDRVFVPRTGITTGDLDAHDIVINARGEVLFANTLFSCVAGLSETHSFSLVWKPPFISRLAAEDRCHLNGLALRDGAPRYVSMVSSTDIADGWRDHRRGGGLVMDVKSGEMVAEGLSMPHSPRFYRDRVWVHDSGRGYFGFIDPERGKFEPICFCPGYLRGMTFIGDFAVVGLSRPRHNKTFSGLDLDDNLVRHKVEPRCGLYVIDLKSGDCVHWLRIEGIVEELYDVVALPGVRAPMALGFKTDEIRRMISIENA